MNPETITTALADELFRRIKAAGHGTVSRLQRKMKVGKNFFASQKDLSSVRLLRLAQAIQLLEIKPVDFFLAAFNPKRTLRAEPSGIGKVARRRLARLGEQPAETSPERSRAAVVKFDDMRHSNPEKALRLLYEEIEVASLELLPWLLGSAASNYRAQYELTKGLDCLQLGLRIAGNLKMFSTAGNLLIRRSYLHNDYGDRRAALSDVDAAMLQFNLAGSDPLCIGMALQERSRLLYYTGDSDEALDTVLSAIPMLEEDSANLASAHHGAALLLAEKRCFREAIDHLKESALHAPDSPMTRGSILWLQARLYRATGALPLATTSFGEALDLYLASEGQHAAVQSAHLGVEFVDCLFSAGQVFEASVVAESLTRVSFQCENSPMIAAAIMTLSEASHQLSRKILEKTRTAVQRATETLPTPPPVNNG